MRQSMPSRVRMGCALLSASLLTGTPTESFAELQLLSAVGITTAELSSDDIFLQFPQRESDLTNPPLDTLAFSEVEAQLGAVIHGRVGALQSLFGINAVFAEIGGPFPTELTQLGYSARGTTFYDAQFRSTTDLAGLKVPFTFVINSGLLRIDDFANLQPNDILGGAILSASVNIDDDFWGFSPRLYKDETTNQMTVDTQIVDTLNLDNFPDLTVEIVDADNDGFVDDAVVNIPEIRGMVMIDGEAFGTFSAEGTPLGGQVDFTYSMVAEVSYVEPTSSFGLAGISDPFALGTPDDDTDDIPGLDDRGVEFFLDDQPLDNFDIVPEPTTLAMLTLGAFALTYRTRRPL